MKRLWPVLGLVLLVVGCAQPRVRVEGSADVDFGAWSRYAWQQRTPEERADVRMDQDKLDREMTTAVDAQLKSKGYSRVEDPAEAQFVVHFSAEIDDRFAVTAEDGTRTIDDPVGDDGGPTATLRYSADGGWRTGAGADAGNERDYSYGRIAVDIRSAGASRVLWRGSVSGEVFPSVPPEKRAKRLSGLMERVFGDFPESR